MVADPSRGGGPPAPAARLEISIDGVPRSHRDRHEIAIEAAARLMAKYPHSPVAVKDLQAGKGGGRLEADLGRPDASPCARPASSPVDNDRQDFTVYCGEWAMGRIYEERGGPDNMRWFWSLYGVVGKPSKVLTNDHAPTLDEAKAQFEAAWRQWLAWAKLQETA